MKNFKTFLEISEELNYKISNDDIEFENRWLYYDDDDEIIYGSDEFPRSDECKFVFNPISCEVFIDGDKFEYDVNNPICIIRYEYDSEEIQIFTDNAENELKRIGYEKPITFLDKEEINNLFEKESENYKYIFVKGKTLIASTFDIIEEN